MTPAPTTTDNGTGAAARPVKQISEMTDEEFYRLEKEANKTFREFKQKLKREFPNLYKAIKQHEKEQDEKDILMVDLFSSKFAIDVERSSRGLP